LTLSTTTAVRPERQARAHGDVLVGVVGLTKRFPVRRTLAQVARRPFAGAHKTALDDVSLTVGRGEVFGLLGPNGAGKTTLFKILSTLVVPDQGAARVAEFDVIRDAAQVRRILTPVIPDERSLYWRISARENLRLYAALYGIPGGQATSRVAWALQLVGLADTGNQMVGQFSSGMKQRLLLARGLLAEPQVLLLDEPTRSLDPVSAKEMRSFIRDQVVSAGSRTVIIATHNPEEAMELCDRVAILDRGRVMAVGTPDTLALQLFEHRYRLWTTTPGERVAAQLVCHQLARDISVRTSDEPGWSIVEMEVVGGMDEAAEIVRILSREGVVVGRFERVRPSLADLIERVVQSPATSS
jgi:ABC-type multidrug transport system ATPase subunit